MAMGTSSRNTSGKKKASGPRPPPPGGQRGYQQRPPPPGGYYQQQHHAPPPRGGYYGGPPPNQEYRKVFKGKFGSYLNYPRGDNDHLLAGLCYLLGWIVAVIVLLGIKPCSPYLRFHACQSIGLTIIYSGGIMILMMISFVLMFVLIGFICYFFVIILAFMFWFYLLFISIQCFTGKDHRVPYLADYVEENFV